MNKNAIIYENTVILLTDNLLVYELIAFFEGGLTHILKNNISVDFTYGFNSNYKSHIEVLNNYNLLNESMFLGRVKIDGKETDIHLNPKKPQEFIDSINSCYSKIEVDK